MNDVAPDVTTEKPAPQRPLPQIPEPDTDHWWRAAADHRLLYQVSPTTETPVFYPRMWAPGTLEGDLEWRESAGRGTVYTFTVLRKHGHPFFRAHLPYVVGYVDLDEGFRMLTQIDVDPDEVRIGARVHVTWEDHDELSVPVFVPDED